VWSWDITKLLGPVTWSYCYRYVMLDIFSRYVVGWMIATAESAVLAQRLISGLEGPDSMLSPEQWLHNRVAKRGLIICDKDTGLHVGYSYNYLDLLNRDFPLALRPNGSQYGK